jgi:hypothetical protein
MTDLNKLRRMRREAQQRDASYTLRFGLTAKIESGRYVLDVAGKPGYYYVREMIGKEVVGVHEALNGDRGVARKPNIPVRLDFNDKRELEIFGLNTREAELFTGNFPGSLGVAPHSHAVGSGNEIVVETRQLEDFLCWHRPNDPDLTVYVNPGWYKDSAGVDSYWPGGTKDLTGYVPTVAATKCWAKVGIDPATAAVVAAQGSAVSLLVSLGPTDLAAISFLGYIPSAGVLLKQGQTIIDDEKMFLDCRELFAVPVSADATSGYILIQDQKAQNTQSGTFTSGAWRTRDLNTIVADTTSAASVASNQITLPAGTYRVRAHAPAFSVGQHQLRLYNVTDSALLVLGGSGYSSGSADNSDQAWLEGRFTLAGTKVIELQHYASATQATNGFGVRSNISTEIYASVELIKE